MPISKQLTAHILMVRPAHFGFNAETAENNMFQTRPELDQVRQISQNAIKEFDQMVMNLREAGVDVMVHQDDGRIVRPDSVFPNNWLTMHADGKLITYPMYSALRRHERSEELVKRLETDYEVLERIHLENFEDHGLFLEGTGSMVFDHDHRIVYACKSQRTMEPVLEKLAGLIGYESVVFEASDKNGFPIYHTNVMMALGVDFVVICLDSVDPVSRPGLVEKFAKTGKEVVEISFEQMNSFAGNMIQLKSHNGKSLLVMSESAYLSLNPDQRERLGHKTRLFPVSIPTIEKIGGGSARCMIAENFLSPKS